MPIREVYVPELGLLTGVRPWEYATETAPRASCGICGGSVSGDFICLGCLSCCPRNQAKLAGNRQVAELERRRARKPAPAFVPKGARSPATLTAKEKRSIVKDHRRTAEGRAWLVSQGLMP